MRSIENPTQRAGALTMAVAALMITTGCGEKNAPVEAFSEPTIQMLSPATEAVKADFLEKNPGMNIDAIYVYGSENGEPFYYGLQRLNFAQNLELNDSAVAQIAVIKTSDAVYTIAYDASGEVVAILAE